MTAGNTRAQPKRPLLRWHGGKWILAPWIISHFPAHKVYVEPFGGAGSVLLRKKPSYAEIYNDLDGEVVNLFRIVRENGARLAESLFATPFARREFTLSYEPSSDPFEQARRTVVRSFMGFGSNSHNQATGFRANSNRSGTTPAHDWKNYPSCLLAIVDRLRGVTIENRDALDVAAQHDGEETLHYLDPPYVFSARNKGEDYRHEMDDQEHIKMRDRISDLKGYVIVSGYHSSLYDDLFEGWERIERASLADGARPRREVLWLNHRCAEALDAGPLFSDRVPA